MLCGLILNAVVDGLKQIDWTMGNEFRLLTVSFDPLETPDLANLKRQNYLRDYGRPAAAGGWDFLTGQQEPIKALLDATGYPIRWNESNNQWIHPACVIVVTPDGRLSRYLYGVYFDAKTLRLALVEASQGQIGSTIDHILLWCCQYNPNDGTYTVAAMRLAQAGGFFTLAVLGGFLTFFWRREHGRKPAAPAPIDAENHENPGA
jgi:protein SCO1/2